MWARDKFIFLGVGAAIAFSIFGQWQLALQVMFFAYLVTALNNVEVKINLLLNQSNLRPNEDDYRR